ncbi:MAG: hypothetical protein Q8903_10605 [Bacteroidota bacterium]|nr:hypothetical protein [Bacteroidota bacterium]
MKKNIFFLFVILFSFGAINYLKAQENEPILYYQMEPFDDSLFIKIQQQVFIDPPDPKAEIIVDLRDANNQTVSIKGALYPFLAFTPETRARIQTYPFKLNLQEMINYGSVFTRVFGKMRFGKIFAPPTLAQISSGYQYVNPFFQAFGGERFGIPLKNDIGISMGFGTPYSGPLETNFLEMNFHILGFSGGVYSSVDALYDFKKDNTHNNLYVTTGFQLSYVIPFGNFLQVGYTDCSTKPTVSQRDRWTKGDTLGYHAKILDKGYTNFEVRYPFSFLGSTRAKVYFGQYLGEWHAGFTGREMSLAGSTFDFRFDAMFKSDVRQPQYVLDILVQKIFDSWAFSAFSLGPSVVLSQTNTGSFGVISIFGNMRLKIGTSL